MPDQSSNVPRPRPPVHLGSTAVYVWDRLVIDDWEIRGNPATHRHAELHNGHRVRRFVEWAIITRMRQAGALTEDLRAGISPDAIFYRQLENFYNRRKTDPRTRAAAGGQSPAPQGHAK